MEATLLLSGLGFESGGLSIAHALTRGWPAVPGVAAAMHGLQVAFGLLIQLTLEKRDDAIVAELAEWYRTVGLPRSLADLGAAEASQASLLEAAERDLTAPHVRNFKRALSAAELAACPGRVPASRLRSEWSAAPTAQKHERARQGSFDVMLQDLIFASASRATDSMPAASSL